MSHADEYVTRNNPILCGMQDPSTFIKVSHDPRNQLFGLSILARYNVSIFEVAKLPSLIRL